MKTSTKKKASPAAALGEFNASELVKSVTGFVEQLKSGAARDLRTTTIKLPAPLAAASGEEMPDLVADAEQRARELLGECGLTSGREGEHRQHFATVSRRYSQ